MNQYLLNIATRSTGNDTNGLLPAMPGFINAADSGIVEDFAAENNLQDSAVQNQFVQQSIVPVQPVLLQKVQQAVVLNSKETEKNSEASYISKHIERVEAKEENSPLKNKPPETVSFKIEEPSQKTVIENAEVKHHVNEPGFVNKTVSKIVPEKKETKKQPGKKTAGKFIETAQVEELIAVKKQKINPLEDEDRKKNKLQPKNNSRIERLIPNQPAMENKRPVNNTKTNQPTPKLVIGKIIVEILPPVAAIPQKVITRIVQSSSKASHSKSNKLIFGLGQL